MAFVIFFFYNPHTGWVSRHAPNDEEREVERKNLTSPISILCTLDSIPSLTLINGSTCALACRQLGFIDGHKARSTHTHTQLFHHSYHVQFCLLVSQLNPFLSMQSRTLSIYFLLGLPTLLLPLHLFSLSAYFRPFL